MAQKIRSQPTQHSHVVKNGTIKSEHFLFFSLLYKTPLRLKCVKTKGQLNKLNLN